MSDEGDCKGTPIGINPNAKQCHPERSEGSGTMGREMLRGVNTERSECAQHDRAVPSLAPAPDPQ